ncbi:MAG: glycosyl transferase family 28, partial [Ferruginibacter sp.]
MKGKNFNSPYYKLRVLVAPLDWGLGHTTRCIPVILKLIELNCEVIIAAEGPAKFLLQQEFPEAEFVNLRGYRITYSRSRALLFFRLFIQFPKIINRIYAEHSWLKKAVIQNKIDAVISDNRFGLYHAKIPCIYITHQLCIKTGNRLTERIAQKLHYRYINKFKECWVPDLKEEINLAGKLSHPVTFPHAPVKYIG